MFGRNKEKSLNLIFLLFIYKINWLKWWKNLKFVSLTLLIFLFEK